MVHDDSDDVRFSICVACAKHQQLVTFVEFPRLT